ncbi:type VI secretion system baseplate subunit TssG [Inquilinus sp. NPDC058860]|uniref:type VI secretion system baseplate subunit TssG n=1 Tax=Inquilinus sp. NPDC058860 TaxID=3346652 RepID=UPI0036963C56
MIAWLHRRPWAVEAFQAVRLAETAARRRHPGADRRGRPIGEDLAPGEEAIRLASATTLSFPSASVARFDPPSDPGNGPPRLTLGLFGLIGPSGVLPSHLTAEVNRAVRLKRPALRAFLDIFLHRLASLFYRAWAKYRLPIAFERAGAADDPITTTLFSLTGLGTDHLRGRLSVDDKAIIHYAGHFARWPRSASALAAMLSDDLGLPVAVRQFEGTWLALPPQERTVLPTSAAPDGNFCRLGLDAVVGERVWDVRGKFQIRVGPVSWDRFRALMPGSPELRRVAELTRLYVGPALSFNVRLVLDRREVPLLRLGGDTAPQLGWTGWAASRPPPHDPSDAVFEVDHV